MDIKYNQRSAAATATRTQKKNSTKVSTRILEKFWMLLLLIPATTRGLCSVVWKSQQDMPGSKIIIDKCKMVGLCYLLTVVEGG